MDGRIDRRAFIAQAAAPALAAVTLAAGLDGCAASRPRPFSLTVDLSRPEFAALAQVGGSVKVPVAGSKPVIITRVTEMEYLALSSHCPHWGCEVGLPAGDAIVCPCHDSRFDRFGVRLSGPAREGLLRGQATLADGMLAIRFR